MKTRKSFGVKLWLWFLAFSAAIFLLLWLLQTVFLQSFYNGMAIRHAEQAADEIAEHDGEEDFYKVIDEAAVSDSLLIFVTDGGEHVLYSADAYQRLYGSPGSQPSHGTENPHLQGTVLNWEKGALRNLPYSYSDLTVALNESDSERVGFETEDGSAYVMGLRLSDGNLLCISMPLGTVSGTVRILRIQLIWVSLLSLLLGFVLSWRISRRFAAPVQQIANSAREIAAGEYHPDLPKGFCTELDALSDTLAETALRLERAQKAQREFLANVSHDLRTPLTLIRGYAEMVEDLSWEDPETRERDLGIIKREADRLTALVNEILEFSALQSGEVTAFFRPFCLTDTAQAVLRQFLPLCEKDGYVIDADLTEELCAEGDEEQIRRVIYNFVDNAICHTDDSRRIRVSLKQKENRARMEVTDYGAGIPEDEVPYIWDRYYTSRNRKNRETVSGLGLSIAREILIRHNAAFGADTREHCTFWFELPVCTEVPSTSVRNTGSGSGENGKSP